MNPCVMTSSLTSVVTRQCLSDAKVDDSGEGDEDGGNEKIMAIQISFLKKLVNNR